MTRREFEQGSNNAGTSTSPNTDLSQVIWVVAISGEVVPQFGRGSVFTWGIYLVNADNGDILGMLAGAGPWPSYFDSLPNRDGIAPIGPSASAPLPLGDESARVACAGQNGGAPLLAAFTSTAGIVADWVENKSDPTAPHPLTEWRSMPASAPAYLCYFGGTYAIPGGPPGPGASASQPVADRTLWLVDSAGRQIGPAKYGPSALIPLARPGEARF
jgi:hypothetical protein